MMFHDREMSEHALVQRVVGAGVHRRADLGGLLRRRAVGVGECVPRRLLLIGEFQLGLEIGEAAFDMLGHAAEHLTHHAAAHAYDITGVVHTAHIVAAVHALHVMAHRTVAHAAHWRGRRTCCRCAFWGLGQGGASRQENRCRRRRQAAAEQDFGSGPIVPTHRVLPLARSAAH